MDRLQDFSSPVVASVLRQAPYSVEKLLCAWRMAAGADVARVSHVRADAGVITASFDDGHWVRELERNRDILLVRLQSMLGTDVATNLMLEGPAPERRTARGPRARGPKERT